MKLPENIERHPLHRREYLGYDSRGYGWLIMQSTSSLNTWKWYAISNHHRHCYLLASCLSEMGKKLKEFNQLKTA